MPRYMDAKTHHVHGPDRHTKICNVKDEFTATDEQRHRDAFHRWLACFSEVSKSMVFVGALQLCSVLSLTHLRCEISGARLTSQFLSNLVNVYIEIMAEEFADIGVFDIAADPTCLGATRAINIHINSCVAVSAPANMCSKGYDGRKGSDGGLGIFGQKSQLLVSGIGDTEAGHDELIVYPRFELLLAHGVSFIGNMLLQSCGQFLARLGRIREGLRIPVVDWPVAMLLKGSSESTSFMIAGCHKDSFGGTALDEVQN